jgi:large subunit ribosomal protein L5
MYDFLEKLINITLPRVKDFRGLNPKNIDKNGNLNIGFSEHLAFPEISPEEIERVHGVQVTVTTNAGTRDNGLKLLTEFGFPFKK